MSFEYVDLETAKSMSGLRMVVVGGGHGQVPGLGTAFDFFPNGIDVGVGPAQSQAAAAAVSGGTHRITSHHLAAR